MGEPIAQFHLKDPEQHSGDQSGLGRAGQQRGAEASRDRQQSDDPGPALALGQPVASLPRSAQPLVAVLIIAME